MVAQAYQRPNQRAATAWLQPQGPGRQAAAALTYEHCCWQSRLLAIETVRHTVPTVALAAVVAAVVVERPAARLVAAEAAAAGRRRCSEVAVGPWLLLVVCLLEAEAAAGLQGVEAAAGTAVRMKLRCAVAVAVAAGAYYSAHSVTSYAAAWLAVAEHLAVVACATGCQKLAVVRRVVAAACAVADLERPSAHREGPEAAAAGEMLLVEAPRPGEVVLLRPAEMEAAAEPHQEEVEAACGGHPRTEEVEAAGGRHPRTAAVAAAAVGHRCTSQVGRRGRRKSPRWTPRSIVLSFTMNTVPGMSG